MITELLPAQSWLLVDSLPLQEEEEEEEEKEEEEEEVPPVQMQLPRRRMQMLCKEV